MSVYLNDATCHLYVFNKMHLLDNTTGHACLIIIRFPFIVIDHMRLNSA